MAFSERISQLQEQKQRMKMAYNMHLSEIHKKAREQQEAVEEVTEKGKEDIHEHVESAKKTAEEVSQNISGEKSTIKEKINNLNAKLKEKFEGIKSAIAEKKLEEAQKRAVERAEWAAIQADYSFSNVMDSLMEADIAYYEAIKAQLEAEELLNKKENE